MTPLDAFVDERVAALKAYLGYRQPTAVWYAKGVCTGYRHTFDTRTHRIEAPDDMREAVRRAVYAEPGLYQLLSYTRREVRFDVNCVKIRLSFAHDAACALLQQGQGVSAVVMLGLNPESFITQKDN